MHNLVSQQNSLLDRFDQLHGDFGRSAIEADLRRKDWQVLRQHRRKWWRRNVVSQPLRIRDQVAYELFESHFSGSYGENETAPRVVPFVVSGLPEKFLAERLFSPFSPKLNDRTGHFV